MSSGQSVTIDAGGSVLATGWFMNYSINFGTTTLCCATEGSAIFVVKLAGISGIVDNAKVSPYSVYPSPTTNELNLNLNGLQAGKCTFMVPMAD